MQTTSNNDKVLIKVNGEDKTVPQNTSVLSLLELFKINKDRVVIELNKIILKKSDFESTILKENEEVEIVTFVGGG